MVVVPKIQIVSGGAEKIHGRDLQRHWWMVAMLVVLAAMGQFYGSLLATLIL